MKKMLKLLSLFLALATFFAMGGCAGKETDLSTEKNEPFVPEKPYLIMATDIQNGAVAVIDLDAEDPMNPQNYYWYWTADEALGWKHSGMLKKNLSDVRLRWSELHQTYVVLMTAASGWVGIAEYPSGKCLWETADTITGPHAVEMLPSGDLVVAFSGATNWETKGYLVYYDTTDGKDYTITHMEQAPSAHGVLWDPEYNLLWANTYTNLEAYEIITDDAGRSGLAKIEDGPGALLVAGNAHDLMPDYSDPNLIWVTCGKAVVKYDKAADKVLNTYTYSQMVGSKYNVKGIASFADGAVAYSKVNETGGNMDTFYVLWPLDREGKEAEEYEYKAQDGAFWNKVRVFDPDYQ